MITPLNVDLRLAPWSNFFILSRVYFLLSFKNSLIRNITALFIVG